MIRVTNIILKVNKRKVWNRLSWNSVKFLLHNLFYKAINSNLLWRKLSSTQFALTIASINHKDHILFTDVTIDIYVDRVVLTE